MTQADVLLYDFTTSAFRPGPPLKVRRNGAPPAVGNDVTSMTFEQAMTFAIPVGGLPMPAATTWRQRVDTAPAGDLDSNSANLTATFLAQRTANYGEVALNFENYNVGFHDLRGRGLPIKDIMFNRNGYDYTPADFYDPAQGAHFRGMPYDPRCDPAHGTDRALAVLSDGPNGGTQLHEVWQAYERPRETQFVNNSNLPNGTPLPANLPGGGYPGITVPEGGYWSGMEGGRVQDTATADVSGAFPQSKGSSATGLPNSYGCISMWEIRQVIEGYTDPNDPGRNVVATPPNGPVRADTGLRANGEPVINHALNCALNDARSGGFSWPATRSDGGLATADAPWEGQRFRLNPTVTSAQLATGVGNDGKPMTAIGKAAGEAMRRYGVIITDRTYSSIVFTTESGGFVKKMTGTDPWGLFGQSGAAGGWSGGVGGFEILRGIPWGSIQWLKKDWGKPA